VADVGVFSRYKGFNDFQEAAKKNSIAEALIMAKLQSAGSAGNLPAALQLANEVQRLEATGTPEGIAQAGRIREFAKSMEKGTVSDGQGGVALQPGFVPAVSAIAQGKGYGQQLGKDTVTMQTAGPIAGAKADAANLSDQTYKPKTAFDTALATKNAETINATKETLTKAPGLLSAFDDLKTAATGAPSGLPANVVAAGQNIAGYGDNPGSKAQGTFRVKRAAAENQIRQAFRVAGSGATSDRDALPFIQMLPNESDSEAVKIDKINAALDAVRNQTTALAKARGLPDPFGVQNADGSASLDSFLAGQDPSNMGGDPVDNSNMGDDLPAPITPPAAPKMSPKDIQASLFNARKAIKAGKSKAAIIQKLQDAGIPTEGL